jgi:hypothetical protein
MGVSLFFGKSVERSNFVNRTYKYNVYICSFHTAVLYQIQELYTVQHNTLNVNTL